MQFFIAEPAMTTVIALAHELDIECSTARAALLLDAVAPGWDENVDLDTLEMSSVTHCVLGQQLYVHPYFVGCFDFCDAVQRLGWAIGSIGRIDDDRIYNFAHSGEEYCTLIEARRTARAENTPKEA